MEQIEEDNSSVAVAVSKIMHETWNQFKNGTLNRDTVPGVLIKIITQRPNTSNLLSVNVPCDYNIPFN